MFALLTAALLSQTPAAPSCTTSDRRVEAVIESKRRELQGREYCQFRNYDSLSDIDGDRVPDFLVVFGIEGVGGSGNGTIQFLAVFASGGRWRPVVSEVGRRGKRVIESIRRGPEPIIELDTLEYGPSDAMCCPSRKGTLRLVLKDGEIGPAGE